MIIQHFVPAAIITFALATRLFASDPAGLEDIVRQRTEAAVEKGKVRGLAVGVISGDKTVKMFAGQVGIADSGAPDARTVFEIGSVTKAFTGLLLADMVERGEVRLDQPVAELLGKDAVVPMDGDRPIRLVDLATQTSGLPRLPSNMGLLVNPLNPYSKYQVDDLLDFLKEHKLRRAPGKEYEYSNLGSGLLGTALAKSVGKTYEQLIVERIAQPLKMNDTTITLSDDQKARAASGSSVLGVPAMMWDFPALAGCGAIRSTLDDMLLFMRANLAPEQTPLAKPIALSHQPRFTIRPATKELPESLEIGLGWHITTHDGTKVIWHNGMTGGFASMLIVVPEKNWGVIVLGNSASPKIDELANSLLLDMLHGKLPAK